LCKAFFFIKMYAGSHLLTQVLPLTWVRKMDELFHSMSLEVTVMNVRLQ
jgi:hypothetical protein